MAPEWEDLKKALYLMDEGFQPSLVDLMSIPDGGPYPEQINEDSLYTYWKVTVEIDVAWPKGGLDDD